MPGPGNYDLRSASKHMSESAPAYSFGTRHRERKSDNAPGPNNYTLPQIIGKRDASKTSAPQYSMVGRNTKGGFDEDLTKVRAF